MRQRGWVDLSLHSPSKDRVFGRLGTAIFSERPVASRSNTFQGRTVGRYILPLPLTRRASRVLKAVSCLSHTLSVAQPQSFKNQSRGLEFGSHLSSLDSMSSHIADMCRSVFLSTPCPTRSTAHWSSSESGVIVSVGATLGRQLSARRQPQPCWSA